jgi:RNA 3'-terminal phosphate cyclase (ATP)
LALSAVLGEPVKVENIRVKRPNPGLQAQHLTAVRALASVCRARVEGAELGSSTLTFEPQSAPRSGEYSWDVAEARKGGSAGSVCLVFQALLVPLLVARGESRLFLGGGTHVAWSPPFHYLESVYLPVLGGMGVKARVDLERWGWYPVGGGLMTAQIAGGRNTFRRMPGFQCSDRGEIRRLSGISAAANLPRHIAERQKNRAEEVLRAEGFEPEIEIVAPPSTGRGTVLFLAAEFESVRTGFTSLGRRGKPAEHVADDACHDFLRYYRSEAALDQHLADQIILPLALAEGPSSFTTCRITKHLLTNAWIVERHLDRRVSVDGEQGRAGKVSISGRSDV